MKKIIGYRYQCPTCGYTYKLYNGGARHAADYMCPIHKIVMPAATIEQSEDTMAPVVITPKRDTGWIPVEDAAPDEGQEVLASDAKYVYLVEYDSDYGYGDMDGITAWMPLPEPYQPQMLAEAGKYADNDTLMPGA